MAPFSVADALDRYVEANGSVHPWDGLWHPSAISGCIRKAIYAMRQVPETDPPTPKQKRILFLGTRFHEIVQAAVSGFGETAVHTEVRVLAPDLNLTGAADQLVIVMGENGEAELQEYKTIKEWGFKALLKDGAAPKDDHLEQVKSYMLTLRQYGGVAEDGTVLAPYGDRLNRVRITYIEKQTFDTKEFVIEWDPAWETDVRSSIAELDMYREHPDSLPPRLPMNGKKRDFRCDWGWGKCPYLTRCWDQDPDEIPVDF